MKRILTTLTLLTSGCVNPEPPAPISRDTSDVSSAQSPETSSTIDATTFVPPLVDASTSHNAPSPDLDASASHSSRDLDAAAPVTMGQTTSETDSQRLDASVELRMLCETCVGDFTLASSGEPPLCTPTTTAISATDAEELGYPLRNWLENVTGEFSAPIGWFTEDGLEETLTLQVSETGMYQYVEMVPAVESECEDYVQAELEITLSTSQNTVVGTVRGYASLQSSNGSDRAAVSEINPALSGNLNINVAELGTPDALIAQVNLARFDGDLREVRLGVDILGVFRASGEADVTNVLGIAQPTDGCSVFSLPDPAQLDAGACIALDKW